jgi:SAM-dependent methyltransferase
MPFQDFPRGIRVAKDVHFNLFNAAIRHYLPSQGKIRVLEIGCGNGAILQSLLDAGYDAYGCDIIEGTYSHFDTSASRTRAISLNPYRLPFEDGEFDIVVSANVLEHVTNKRETLLEIKRVMRPGGYTFHAYPSKWYLPVEVHILVPFASWMWPRVPRWWLALWAIAGVRNGYQTGMDWRKVASDNHRFCAEAIHYISTAQYARLFEDLFGNFSRPGRLYLQWHTGGVGRMFRRAPVFVQHLVMETREQFIVGCKTT